MTRSAITSASAAVAMSSRSAELVAADSAQCVPGPQQRYQPARDRYQQLVADVVAVEVVDGLEGVEADEQHRGDVVGPPGPFHRAVQQCHQQVRLGAWSADREGSAAAAVPACGGVLPGLRVHQVASGHTCQDLRCVEVLVGQLAGDVAVQIQGAQSVVAEPRRVKPGCTASPCS